VSCCVVAGLIPSQGEEQKKLDVISNDIFCNCLRNSGRTGVIASEEEATPVAVEETDSGNYIVVFDPLDGSSNIDAGGWAGWGYVVEFQRGTDAESGQLRICRREAGSKHGADRVLHFSSS